jgi:hypothetical protein
MVAKGTDAARAIAAGGRRASAPCSSAHSVIRTAAAPPAAAGAAGEGWEGLNPEKVSALVERAPYFVLLDFRRDPRARRAVACVHVCVCA